MSIIFGNLESLYLSLIPLSVIFLMALPFIEEFLFINAPIIIDKYKNKK